MKIISLRFALLALIQIIVSSCGASQNSNGNFTDNDLTGTWKLTVVYHNTTGSDAQESWNQTIEMDSNNRPIFTQPDWQDGRDLQISSTGTIQFRLVLHANGPPREIDHFFQGIISPDKKAANGTHSVAYTGTWQWQKIE